jgi:hypothetical protein
MIHGAAAFLKFAGYLLLVLGHSNPGIQSVGHALLAIGYAMEVILLINGLKKEMETPASKPNLSESTVNSPDQR